MEKSEMDNVAYAYGASHGLPIVTFGFEDEGSRIYFLTSDSLTGRKTGPPRFIRVCPDGTIFNDFSSNERYSLLARFNRLNLK